MPSEPLTLRVTRRISRRACADMAGPFEPGAILHEYRGVTYGCISPGGIAVTLEPDQTPFFEVPLAAVEIVE